jgi:branched-chain amino acid transport system permease protein
VIEEHADAAGVTGARPVGVRPAWAALGPLVLLVAATPWVGNRYHVSFVFFLCLHIVMASSYDVLAGYMGYMNLGHGAFFGLGAYVYGLTLVHGGPIALGLLAALFAGAVLAVLVGAPLLRLREAYFAIATLGILKVLEVLATNLRDVTGGTTGLSIEPTRSTIPTYYAMLALCLLALGLNMIVAHSRLGLGLLGIRDDEAVAEASGIDTRRLKFRLLVLSSFLPGLAGGVYMWQLTYIDPASAFSADVSLGPVIMAMLGGTGTVAGPVVGAVFLTVLEEVLWSKVGKLQLAMYGTVLVLVGVFMPGGLMRSRPFAWLYRTLRFPDHYGYRVNARAGRQL